jgi:hypothetical protein
MSAQHDSPDYDVTVEADDLLADLAADAAEYGKDFEENRRWWRESLDFDEWHEARYWMLEASGGQRAYAESLAALQPGGRFRADGGMVDVRGYMAWLSGLADRSHDRSHGPYTETRQAAERETAYTAVISTLRDDYGVGWPRLDDIGGTPLEEDLP